MVSLSKLGFLVLGSVMFVGCSSSPVSQAKIAAASPTDIVHRDDAVNVMADAVCKRYEKCSGFSNNGKYANADDCRAGEHQKWAKNWSADDCGGATHGVVADKVRECKARAEVQECSGNLFDKISEWTECRTDKVCQERKNEG